MKKPQMDSDDVECSGDAPGDAVAMDLSCLNAPSLRVEDLVGFVPRIVDRAYLSELGVLLVPAEATLAGLVRGSQLLERRLALGKLAPRPRVLLTQTDPGGRLEIHNYTGACPTLTYEINPVSGCHVGCLYCLVTDGSHEQELTVLTNYAELVSRALEERHAERHFFYFSPKTEAFQEPTLQTGVAHQILLAFIDHYERHPGSLARLFIASKAGVRQLEFEYRGASILSLLEQLAPRMQFNTSVSLMPDCLRRLLEPNAPPLEERLAAVQLCQAHGIFARSALVQPVVTPFFDAASVGFLFAQLARAGIINFKPELLTVNPECLAVLGQIIGYTDRDAERGLYEAYLAPSNARHKKQRERIAPERAISLAVVERMLREGDRHGMTASICYWVRESLGISESVIPSINRNGFQCLGYQTRLFEKGAV
jgi:DNA repair photolyase